MLNLIGNTIRTLESIVSLGFGLKLQTLRLTVLVQRHINIKQITKELKAKAKIVH